MKKRGISPVIATVLLVVMVVSIGIIIFLWFRGMVDESVTKFGKSVRLACDDVSFEAEYSGGSLSISNIGNTPIFGMKIKIFGAGNYETAEINELDSNWKKGLNQGGTFVSRDISNEVGSANKIILTPVLLGTTENGEKSQACEEEKNGVEVQI